MIYKSILDTVGKTPLVGLKHMSQGLEAEVLIKAEFFNPLFSVKDRIGKAMIEAAEKEGKLKKGGVIVEPTSGNTGISLAFVARAKGYRCLLTMPESMSLERRILLELLGAELVLTPAEKGMSGAIAKAKEIVEKLGEAFSPQQFENPANPEVHRQTTAEEIWEATEGKIDVFVSGVGTGGTITGVSEVIKSRTDLYSVAVEPKDSPVISGGEPGPHKIQGIGAGFIPKNLNQDIIDEVVSVSNDCAFEIARELSLKEGLPAGISSGASISVALDLAKRKEFKGKRIVVIAASANERYLSTPLADKARSVAESLSVEKIH